MFPFNFVKCYAMPASQPPVDDQARFENMEITKNAVENYSPMQVLTCKDL
jgi:hypothetical protein